MNLSNTLEHHIPIRATKVGRRTQACDGILVAVDVVDHDVVGIVDLDLRGQIRVDLNVVVHVLGFNGEEERAEPFEGAKVTADPEEVNFAETSLLLGVVHAVPDALEDGSEWGDTNTGTNEDDGFVFEDIFGGGAEWTVDVDSRKDTADCWVCAIAVGSVLVDRDYLRGVLLLVNVTTESTSYVLGEITNHTHMDGDVVLFWCGGEREGMILIEGHLGAAEENVLSCTSLGILLLDLNLTDVTGMLNNLGNVGLVLSSNLSRNSLHQINVTSIHPVLPEDSNGTGSQSNTVWCEIWLNHAEGSVDRPEDEENDEQMMRIPETFKIGAAIFLIGSNGHGR